MPLDALLEQMCPSQDTAPSSVRKRQDAQKRLDELYTKLSTGGCSETTIQQTTQLAQAVAQQDFATANRLHMELSKGDWKANREWLMGVKRLLPR
jgi:cell division septum initiation protein DivIVA